MPVGSRRQRLPRWCRWHHSRLRERHPYLPAHNPMGGDDVDEYLVRGIDRPTNRRLKEQAKARGLSVEEEIAGIVKWHVGRTAEDYLERVRPFLDQIERAENAGPEEQLDAPGHHGKVDRAFVADPILLGANTVEAPAPALEHFKSLDLLAPDFLLAHFYQQIWRSASLGVVRREHLLERTQWLASLRLELHRSEPLLPAALELGFRLWRPMNECACLAVALSEGVRVLTIDAGLKRALEWHGLGNWVKLHGLD